MAAVNQRAHSFRRAKCSCGGWTKITDPTEEIAPGVAVKVGNGLWRIEKKLDGTAGYDQLNGIAKVPPETVEESSGGFLRSD